jgi:hypothetical protein
MPKGKWIPSVRVESAAYQAAILNWCEETRQTFTIGADQDAAVNAEIRAIPGSARVKFQDNEIGEA